MLLDDGPLETVKNSLYLVIKPLRSPSDDLRGHANIQATPIRMPGRDVEVDLWKFDYVRDVVESDNDGGDIG